MHILKKKLRRFTVDAFRKLLTVVALIFVFLKRGYTHSRAQLLKPGEKVQQEMLVGGLVELLTKIADGKETVFCLPGPDNCFQPTAHFGIDGITEKVVWMFEVRMIIR